MKCWYFHKQKKLSVTENETWALKLTASELPILLLRTFLSINRMSAINVNVTGTIDLGTHNNSLHMKTLMFNYCIEQLQVSADNVGFYRPNHFSYIYRAFHNVLRDYKHL